MSDSMFGLTVDEAKLLLYWLAVVESEIGAVEEDERLGERLRSFVATFNYFPSRSLAGPV